MYGFLLFLHLLICFSLVCVVLIQSGKGGGLAGGAFGGSAQTVFGGRGATDFITRATMVLGAAFFVTSLTLALMSSGGARARSLIQEQARHASGAAPAQLPGQRPPSTSPAPAAPALPAPAGTTPPKTGP